MKKFMVLMICFTLVMVSWLVVASSNSNNISPKSVFLQVEKDFVQPPLEWNNEKIKLTVGNDESEPNDGEDDNSSGGEPDETEGEDPGSGEDTGNASDTEDVSGGSDSDDEGGTGDGDSDSAPEDDIGTDTGDGDSGSE
ncbi:hypothetical protein ACFL35_14375 [Candidatus Riflebacteria bacterium]